MKAGTILHWEGFKFDDGGTADKFIIVLAFDNTHALIVLTTTNQWKHTKQPGCNHTPRTVFFIRGDKKNFFARDTWVQVHRPRVLDCSLLLQKKFDGILNVRHELKPNITGAIRNCLLASDDVSGIDAGFVKANKI